MIIGLQVVIGLSKFFTNYGPNKHSSCNWVVNHLRITDFYAFYSETNSPLVQKSLHPLQMRKIRIHNFPQRKKVCYHLKFALLKMLTLVTSMKQMGWRWREKNISLNVSLGVIQRDLIPTTLLFVSVYSVGNLSYFQVRDDGLRRFNWIGEERRLEKEANSEEKMAVNKPVNCT